jgi:hypothetical protein
MNKEDTYMIAKNRTILIILTSLICFGGLLESEENKSDNSGVIEGALVYSEDWSYLSSVNTPIQKINSVDGNYINLPNPGNPKGYYCVSDDTHLNLDVDGDNGLDIDVKSKESFVLYNITYPSGQKLSYNMRFFTKGPPLEGRPRWFYQRACFITVKTSLETFTLIDDNNNGYYNDYGKDAIIIGAGNKQAVPLSSVIQVKGKFYNLKIETLTEPPEGIKKTANYTGLVLKLSSNTEDTGKLELLKNLKAPKDPPTNMIICRGNDTFFLTNAKGESTLPVGDYHLFSVQFGKRVRAHTTEKPLFTIEKDKVVAPNWGGTFKLQLNPYCEKGGDIGSVMPPSQNQGPSYVSKHMDCPFIKMKLPKVIGIGGEEYFAPDEYKDNNGIAFPDGGINSLNVEIKAKSVPASEKPINKKVGNSFVDRWQPVDLTGPRNKRIPYWEDYRCPIEKYRGIVVVSVSVPGSVFGDLSFEQEVEVKE